MKYNDSDMDDLFRRASERYPLRTDSADWDRLVNALENGPTTPSDGEERRKRRFVFLWLLLIPLAGVGYLTWQTKSAHSTHQADVAAAKPAEQGTAVSGDVKTAESGDVKTPNVVAGNGGKATAGNAATADGRGTEGSGKAAGAVGNGQGNAGSAGTAVVGSDGKAVTDGKTAVGGDGKAATGSPALRNIDGKSKRSANSRDGAGLDVAAGQKGGTGGLKGTGRGSTSGTGENGSTAVTGRPGKNGSVTGKGDVQEDDALMPALLDLRTVPVTGGFNVAVDVSSPYKPVERPEPATKVSTKRNSHGYIGLLGAPDFSTVKFQSMKGVGTTFGVLLGYSFNDRLAIESGVYLDRKRYYTDGEYFNTKNVHVPAGYSLLNVDGTCYMWEIPVNVRYNFSTSPRMKWFGTAGLSTYFMSKEKYTYAYDYNWTGPTSYSHWNINKPSQYWFSILNLSAGFEQRIGKIGNLRLEPYVRVPLSGIGTGRLSIMSAGLNIGFTHQLW